MTIESKMDASNFFRTEADLALDEARQEKATRTKDQGSPIKLASKPIKIEVQGDNLWTAESGGFARKYSLKTGKVVQTFNGHSGPVTCLALYPSTKFLFTGSWDKTIKIWDISDRSLITSLNAHSDFLKCLLIIPVLNILISGGSDKAIRFWDLGGLKNGGNVTQVGSLSEHSRPVECLVYDPDTTTADSATFFSADSMGVIKMWRLDKTAEPRVECRTTFLAQFEGHSTGVNDMWFGLNQLWTASTDCTVLVHDVNVGANASAKGHPPLEFRKPVKAILPLSLTLVNEPILVVGSGEDISSFDVSMLEEPESKGLVEGHWHDVTALRLWVKQANTPSGFEPMIISASLDGTVRRWTLKEILDPVRKVASTKQPPVTKSTSHGITDAELDELLASDEE